MQTHIAKRAASLAVTAAAFSFIGTLGALA